MIISDQKKEIERLKNSLALVEKGNSVIETENKIKATQFIIDELNHKRRGYENTLEC